MTKITLEDKALVVVMKRDGDSRVLIPPGSPITSEAAGRFLIALGNHLVSEGTPSDTPSNLQLLDI